MRKQLPYMAVTYFLSRAFFIGVLFSLLIRTSKVDAWISFLLCFVIGFLFLFVLQYIASYEPEKSLREKYIDLFPKSYPFWMLISILLFLFLAVVGFWNLSNLITSQFLNKTPKFVIQISFLIPLLLLLRKECKIILRVSLVLFYISILLFLLSFIGLIFQFDFTNFLPAFQSNITSPIFPFLGFQVFPLFLLLIFPNQEVKKGMKKGFCLSSLILFLTTITIIGVLGIELCLIYQYPEFHILKRAYQGILTYRLENILAIQWLFDIFIFCTVSLKGCHELLAMKKGMKEFILPILTVFLSIHLFKDNTIANTITEQYLSKIIPCVWLLIILAFVLKIFIKKRRISPTYLKTESIKRPQ